MFTSSIQDRSNAPVAASPNRSKSKPPGLQTAVNPHWDNLALRPPGSLTVGHPGDVWEREADQQADRITTAAGSGLGREETVKPQDADPSDHARSSSSTPPGLSGRGAPLSASSRRYFERTFGQELAGVRLHTDGPAAAMAQRAHAHAFTVGSDIVFAPGRYAPETSEGSRLLAHEMAHVAQQRTQPAPGIQAWVAPTDWLDYIGLAIDLGERVYIELAYEEGQEKNFQRFVNNMFIAIDLAMAALPGAGGGGLLARASHGAAVAAWGVVPASAKVRVAEEVAKRMGWTTVKAVHMIGMYFRTTGSGDKEPPATKGEKGPSGKASTEKYLDARWDKGTFGTVEKSIEYHVEKHGRGLSKVEYTQRAEKAFEDATAARSTTADKLGREAVKVVSEIFGSGLFTPHGRIIWFHPIL